MKNWIFNIKSVGGILFLMTFLVLGSTVSAQFWGMSSNYSGSRCLAVNPSLMTTSFVYADFGLNLGVAAYNDFAFVKTGDYHRLLRGEGLSDYYVNGNQTPLGVVLNEKPKNAYETLDFTVLSAMFSPNGKNAFGIFVNNRVYTDGKHIPWEVLEASIMTLEAGDYIGRNYKSKNTRLGVMAWSEVGFSYSATVYDRYYDKVDFGVTLKGLVGYAGVALDINDIDKDILNADSSVIHKLDLMVAMSAPLDYNAAFSDGNVLNLNGMPGGCGFGFDIGVTYTNKKDGKISRVVDRPCVEPRIYYNWRLGVSLLDVGAVRFANNARIYKLMTDTDKIFDVTRFDDVETMESLMDTLCGMFYENPEDAYVGDRFLMGLPTALSVQFDYNIYRSFYVNATWIQPIRLFKYSSIRPAQLVVEPRFETRYFDFTVPVTFYNYEKIFLGAELRLAFLSVGTQNVFNFFGGGLSYGLDLYVALKFNLYKGKCFGGCHDACWNADFR